MTASHLVLGFEAITRPRGGQFRPPIPPGGLRIRLFGAILAGKTARQREPFTAPPRLMAKNPRGASRATGAPWWGGQMSGFKLAAGSSARAMGAAVVPAPAAGRELNPQVAPTAKPQANAARALAKSDRLTIRRAKPEPGPVTSACPQEPWPYGCQWRSPTRKVLRPSRPSCLRTKPA